MSRLYILIATAGRPRLLQRTLESLASCRKPERYEAAIIVENGPPCGVEPLVRSFETALRARYLHVPQANKSRALNEALATLEEGLVFFTDDDVRVHPDLLVAYAAAVGDRKSGAFFGGPVGVDYEREPPAWLLAFLPISGRGWTLGNEPRELGPSDPHFFLGCNWAAFVPDLKAIGGFDESYGPGSPTGSRGQERMAQDRLLAVGADRIYVPDAMVWHYVPRSNCTPWWVLRRGYANGVTYARRSPPGRAFRPGDALQRLESSPGMMAKAFLLLYGVVRLLGYLRGRFLPVRDSFPRRT